MPDNHFNQVELARRWKLSARTLERWRWQGTGPSFLKVGGRVLYRLEDIEAFEAAKMRAGETLPARSPVFTPRLVSPAPRALRA